MNLIENAKNKINSLLTSSPNNISYSFIGITTIILGYYTFFENDIEIPSPTLSPTLSPIPTSIQPQYGGKNKKTQKYKK